MGQLEQMIEQAILKTGKKLQVKQVLTGVATDVGESTCTVKCDDAPSLYDVRLNAIEASLDSYFTVYPVEGSQVLVAIIENLETEAVLVRCSEVAKVSIKTGEYTMVVDQNGIVFNDGQKGLVKLAEMVSWMQKVKSDLTTLKTLLQASPVAGNGSPLAITFNPSTPQPQESTFEDEKIKH
jgi:hypothetical protein